MDVLHSVRRNNNDNDNNNQGKIIKKIKIYESRWNAAKRTSSFSVIFGLSFQVIAKILNTAKYVDSVHVSTYMFY